MTTHGSNSTRMFASGFALFASGFALFASAALLVGCATNDGGSATVTLSEAVAPAADETLLDRRADGATLYGRVEAQPIDTDTPRILVLRAVRQGQSLDASLDGARVLDARFAGSSIVTIGADGVLRVHAHGVTTELDRDAEPPLSVAGSVVAYARGAMPSFELASADLVTGVVRQWTDGMAPVWSPALSPDAAEIVFVSGASGAPRLYRLEQNGAPVALPETASFPSSLRAPRWQDATLHFEDETGTPRELAL